MDADWELNKVKLKLKGSSWSKSRGTFVIVKDWSRASPGLGQGGLCLLSGSLFCWGTVFPSPLALALILEIKFHFGALLVYIRAETTSSPAESQLSLANEFFRNVHVFCLFPIGPLFPCWDGWSDFSLLCRNSPLRVLLKPIFLHHHTAGWCRLCQATTFRSPAAARLCLCFLQLNCHFSKLLSRHERQNIWMDLQKKLGKSWSLKIQDLEVTFITVRWFRCPQSWSKSFLSKSPRECKWIAIGAEKSRCSGEWKPGRQRASV